jgi:hypothetical protein
VYSYSDFIFGNDYNVIEKKTPVYNNLFGNRIGGYINYLIFSRKTGLLMYDMLMEGDRILNLTEFVQYKEIDGFRFPIKIRLAPNRTKILTDSPHSAQFRNEINKILQPRIRLYKNIQFNQPIDESVFDMN